MKLLRGLEIQRDQKKGSREFYHHENFIQTFMEIEDNTAAICGINFELIAKFSGALVQLPQGEQAIPNFIG